MPRGPAWKRVGAGPFSGSADVAVGLSAERLLLYSAVAVALLSVFAMRRADLRGMSAR